MNRKRTRGGWRIARRRLAVAAAVLWMANCLSTALADTVRPPGWAVASAHTRATDAAYWVAQKGGNAFDAAVAVSAVLSVAEPMSSGIGGGGFWLLHRAGDGLQVMVDGRERAPLLADRDMYLDDTGNLIPGLSLDGALAAAVPGEPAALAHIAAKYGRLSLATSLQPAIELAEQGFVVGERFRRMAKFRAPAFNSTARDLFLLNGQAPDLGSVIRQPELADTLQEMAVRGREGFYGGWVASTLIREITAAGGIWTQQDLAEYRVVERAPEIGRYRDARYVSASLPSSGGIVLSQMLNMIELQNAPLLDRTGRTHSIVESMRRAYRDRALYLGDPEFTSVEHEKLTAYDYARRQIDDITAAATPSSTLPSLDALRKQGEDTSHFSIIDAEGNRVAATLSINYPFGSGFVSAGTGVVLNNEMDDFSSKPGVANVYGLVGGEANAIEPGKRPLSSMSPTFVETGDFIAVIGTPGGSRIITMVLLALLELVDNGERDIEKVVNLPRYHHQYLPDKITYETGALDDTLAAELEARGHALSERDSPYGDMQAVLWRLDTGEMSAASDGRGEGSARIW